MNRRKIIDLLLRAVCSLIFLLACKEQGKQHSDAIFKNGSQIENIVLNRDRVELLTNLGMIWGFLKYYHPSIASGRYNWDVELFRMLPKILAAPSRKVAYENIEEWVASLGGVEVPVINDSLIQKGRLKIEPDYGSLFVPQNLPISLVTKLEKIKNNYHKPSTHHYIDIKSSKNPVFSNELSYDSVTNVDVGVRLLSLYRYWNIIQYFYPYRHLIGEDWSNVLKEFIPKFIAANTKQKYVLVCLEIISRIHDTHANIWQNLPALDSAKGVFTAPFKAEFIEKKLVVTGYLMDIFDIKNKLIVGDVINKIDNTPVDDLVKKYLPLTPASNYETQLRDLPGLWGFLLRSNNNKMTLEVKRGKDVKEIFLYRIPLSALKGKDFGPPNIITGFRKIQDKIGYIYPGKLAKNDFEIIKNKFSDTKGLIVDLRCYPSVFMPFDYGQWLKNTSSPFAYFTAPNFSKPGSFRYADTVFNGGTNPQSYKGKIVIIVNAETQSQAEYTAMALSTAPNATVLGSTTAGADGNISSIVLPGGIKTWMSGIGVYYPDGRETQRIGIKVDVIKRPTINGIRQKRDELLEDAIKIIQRN